jgi:hypothetical protein
MFRAILWLLTVVVVFDFCFFHPPHQCLGELWVGEGAWGMTWGQWFPPSPRAVAEEVRGAPCPCQA